MRLPGHSPAGIAVLLLFAAAGRAEVLSRLQQHITALLDHFRGKVYCWDVVNEARSDGHGMRRTDSPLLFDNDVRPKAAFWAVAPW